MTPLLAWLMMFVGYAAPVDPVGLEEFLDQTVPERLDASGTPGVLITVVQGDRVVLAKGWGMADVDREIPMDAERTIFRFASISKTVTATAIAQLEEQGRLDLDAPVDEYLEGLMLPPRFEDPVTTRHLLNHTGGFINNNIDRVSREPSDDEFSDFLAATMAPQVYPPGRVVLYSNHGNALAGLVVESIAQVPFAQYVETNILQPLQMSDSRFGLDPSLADRLATGYMVEGGAARPYEYLHVKTTPASALHSTAQDIGRFMILHLGEGEGEGGTGEPVVLGPAALERMRTRVDAIHPAIGGFHYGFAHGFTAGHPTRRHGGSVPGFQSRMVLFDESDVGIFVGHNAYGVKLRDELVVAIATQILPKGASPPAVVPAGDGRAQESEALVGTYRRTTIADTPGFNRARTVLAENATMEVAIDGEGFLTVDDARFVRTGELEFHREREGKRPQAVVFVRDEQGRVRWIHRDTQSAQRRPWHASPWVQLPLYAGALLVLVVASLGTRVWWRLAPPARARMALSAIAARVCLLGVIVPQLYSMWLDQGQPPLMKPLRFGHPWWLDPVRGLTLLGVVVAFVALYRLWRARGEELGAGPLRRALWIALAAGLLPLLELYWMTPDPGLVSTS